MNRQTVTGFELGDDAVAIIGMACRLPGGNDTPDKFWSFLKRKGNGISTIPEARWNTEIFYHENPDSISKSVSKWAGFIDHVDCFDPQFFGISPREADAMDPQQRLLLQTTFEAMEDSRIPASVYSSVRTGVFVGISQSDYRSLQEMRLTSEENFAGTGYALCIAANRISHRLNLSGPSLAIDTACSSSMVALDQAVQNLAAGSCDMAVVAGVNMLLHPSSFLAFSNAGMLSPTGRISTFDQAANGFVRGEGVGVVIVKPYARALADGDPIHAVVHATASNQDGRTSTMTAPNQDAQKAMLETLIAKAGVGRDQIGFVEAHGTGTPIGDPIEAGAIGRVIGQHNPRRPVFVGSGKANIGHGESLAGVTGLIKAALAVREGEVPPNANFKTPNPNIPLDALNLQVPEQVETFPESEGRRYAAINSFGFGGTNASALISGADAPRRLQYASAALPETDDFPLFFPLSAASAEGLAQAAARLAGALGSKGRLADTPLPAISRGLATGRSALKHRAVVLARSRKELTGALRKLARGDAEALDKAANIVTGQAQPEGKLCFMFSGQGSQWWAMARGLLTGNATFAMAVEQYDAAFQKAAGWSIKAELLKDEADSRIDDTTVTQPALFAIQAGLAALWRRFGVTPDMVVGHSIGEAAAAYVAGGLSLDGAATFLSRRGMIRDQLGQKGAMAAIGLNHADVEPLLPDHGLIGIAAVNGPGSTTVSGDYDAIHDFVEDFQIRYPDTFIRSLVVDTAWHSYQLDAGEEWFRREVAQIDWSTPELPFISTVTGGPEVRFDTDYGWLNLRRPVMFQKGVEAALRLGATRFLELGPHSTLNGPARSTALEAGARVEVLASLDRKGADCDAFARTAAQLFAGGLELDWDAITAGCGTPADLPWLVWQDEPHWNDSDECEDILRTPYSHPFLGKRTNEAGYTWRSEINVRAYPYLKDHRLQTETLFPGAGYIDTFLAVGREVFGPDKLFELTDTVIHDAMFLPAEGDLRLSTTYDPGRGIIRLYSRQRETREDWVLRAEGRLNETDVAAPRDIAFAPETTKLKQLDVAMIYQAENAEHFVNYGPTFQTVDGLWMRGNRTVARISYPKAADAGWGTHFTHPTMLDGCLQIVDPRVAESKGDIKQAPGDDVYLPVGAQRIRFYGSFPDVVYVHARQTHDPLSKDKLAGFTVTDVDGRVLMVADGLAMRALPTKALPPEGEVLPQFVSESWVELRDAPSAETAQGSWLLLAEPGAQRDALAAELTAAGAELQVLARADVPGRVTEGLSELFGDAFEAGQIAGIVYAWPLALPDPGQDGTADGLLATIDPAVNDLISLGDLMDFYRQTETGLARIVVLTQGAFDEGASTALVQQPLAVVARALATETPEYSVRMIDIDHEVPAAEVVDAILGETDETELRLAGGKVTVPRLQLREPDGFDPELMTVTGADTETNFHATMRSPGVIDDLELCEIPLAPLQPGEVRVRIAAVGLNFRDIMAVTGLLPSEAEPDPAWQQLGLEFGGEVVEVGEGVGQFAPGDRVMGMGRRCLQRFMACDARALTHLPDNISMQQAATIPSAFTTAHHALNRVGRMQTGDRVLIHVATGGVGTAAVQLAQAEGAEIFATAGSPRKRKVLKDQGVSHVMDSRSLKFADDVMRITKGQGVDLLLNSLPGEYIVKGLEIMAPYGRFLEIGKRDVYEDSSIGMKALRRNVSLSVLDLAAMGHERPESLGEMFGELIGRFETGELTPLPVNAFPVSRLADAFRFMSQAKHIGKVVVTLDEPSFAVRRDPDRPMRLSAEASYLVTGGTRGFGLACADWLSRAGAGELILASRAGAAEGDDAKRIARIEARGTRVTLAALDVTDQAQVSALIGARAGGKRPLAGILHAAAVIRDGFANQLTDEMISDVLAPKVAGGWALHKALQEHGVTPDFLIGFGSVSQVMGSGGQSNYVAANAFLDAMAKLRRTQGLAGRTVKWGAIAESGFVSRNDGLASYLESVGLMGLSDAEAEIGLELALSRDAGDVTFAKADWEQIARANPAVGTAPRFAPLVQKGGSDNSEVRARLMSLEGEALVEEASDFVRGEISAVLKIDADAIEGDRPMSELGLDSLSSFELKMRVETALGLTLPVSKFLSAPTVDELSGMLAEEIREMCRVEAAAAAAEADDAVGPGAVEEAAVVRATNAQAGLLRHALAPMTSGPARGAMEHVESFPSDADRAAVQKALGRLLRRHPGLGLTGAADGLQFGGVAPDVVDAPAPLDPAAGELLQVALADGRATLRMHAAMGDARAAARAARELRQLLAGDTLPRAVPASGVRRALAALSYDAEAPEGQNDRGFWWYGLAEDLAPLRLAGRGRALAPAGQGRNHGPGDEIAVPMAAETGEADLMIALAGALRQVAGGRGSVLMSRVVDQRAALGVQGAVGQWAALQPVSVPETDDAGPRRAVLERCLARAGAHTRFDSYAAEEHFAEHFQSLGVTPFQIAFSGDIGPDRAGGGALFDIYAWVADKGDGPEMRLCFDRDALSQADARALAKAIGTRVSGRVAPVPADV